MTIPDWTKRGRHWAGRCYHCQHRRELPGNAHSSCALSTMAPPVFHDLGLDMGWADWPFNFDPVWLQWCDGFEKVPND